MKVFSPSLNECQNKKGKKNKKTLVCVASDFYPDHVSVFWQVDGLEAKDGVATDAAAVREGEHYRITSRLRVPLRDWFTPSKNFTCTVRFFNGTQTVDFSHWTVGIEGLFISILILYQQHLDTSCSHKTAITCFSFLSLSGPGTSVIRGR